MRTFVYWHLLSLDAPTVAVVWTVFTAAANGLSVPFTLMMALGIGVWMIYALDRLLDTRHLSVAGIARSAEMTDRHCFHRGHRVQFSIAIAVATVLLLALLPLLSSTSLRFYLSEGVLIAGYFWVIHRPGRMHPLPKELLIGPFFSSAIFIPVLSLHPSLRPSLVAVFILFAALCNLNCLYIYAWEHLNGMPEAHWATAYAVRNLFVVTLIFVAVSVGMSFRAAPFLRDQPLVRLYPLVCALSALTLGVINRLRFAMSPLTLRASADATMLTPLFVLPSLFHFAHR